MEEGVTAQLNVRNQSCSPLSMRSFMNIRQRS